MNQANAPPEKGRRFYTILGRADGLVDVYLDPHVYPMTADGMTDYDLSFRAARGVDPNDYPDLEEHIRAHYEDWCEIAEAVWM